ncbi:hypothetical protein FW774_16235 [Pedobacter sp. BS3]|nr:hypothetical protein FW774_16235 [Pedobacter sp. BS3]
MKKLLLCTMTACFTSSLLFAQDFQEGNLVLLRIPNYGTESGGTAANNGNKAVPMYLDAYDPDDIAAGITKTVPLPTTSDGTNYALTANGSSSATPYISRSVDGRYLVVQGFDVAVGTDVTTSGISYSTTNPSFALVNYQGNVSSTTKVTNNIPGASWMKTTVSYDGTGIWFGNGSNTDGVHYIPVGGTTSTKIGGTYARSLMLNDKKLIMGYGTTLYSIGTADLPTTLQTASTLTIDTKPLSCYGFVILKNKTGDKVLYLCDYGTTANHGIKKYLLEGNTLTYKGVVAYQNLTNVEGRVVYNGDGTFNKVQLYAINASGKLVKIEDTADFNEDMDGTATLLKDFAGVTAPDDGKTFFIRSLAWAPVQNSLLPVKLSAFNARQTAEGIKLTWTTASEQNNSHFDILRSVDGQNFEVVGTVKGNGTTSTQQSYSFTDVNVSNGLYYYQLRQVDFDNKSETNSPIPVKFSLQAKTFKAWLTANNQVKIKLNADKAQKTQVVASDISGKILVNKDLYVNTGANEFSLDLAKYKSPFVISIALDGRTYTEKLIN